MAKYRITAPDGSVFEVTAPDDATEDQVLAYAQQNFAPQAGASQRPQTPAKSADDPSLWAGGVVPSLDPTEGQSFLTNAHQGLGKFFADSGRGIGQMVGVVSQQEVDEARLRDAPLNNTWGGLAGQAIGGATTLMAAPVGGGAALAQIAGRAAPYASAAIGGGALAGIQPVATGESRLGNTATGAALGVGGQGVASGLGVLAGKAAAKVSPAVRQALDAARAAGIPLNVSQVTESAPIRALQAATRYLPFSGATAAAKAQQEAFNRAVAKSFGADATTLSDDVMKAARKKLSDEFNDIYSRNDVAITPDVVRRMLEIERRAAADMPAEQAAIIKGQINRIVDATEEGQLTGQMYQSIRTLMQKAEQQGGYVGSLIKNVRQELDDAAAQSVSADDAARLAKVRGGWANLRVTEDALKQASGAAGQGGGAAGNVRPAALWPLIRKGSTKEMRELAKIGQNVLKDTINDSGTAQRAMYQNMLTGGAGLLATGAGLGKLVAAGALAGRAINSQAAAKLLEQGKPIKGLARLAKPLPRLLPAAAIPLNASATLDVGTVHGYDPNDPRYRGD